MAASNSDHAGVPQTCAPAVKSVRGILRAGGRLVGILAWCGACRLVLACTRPLGWFSQSLHRKARKAISRTWIAQGRRLIGMRLVVYGEVPKPPYFLVCNHAAWFDLFGMCTLCDATIIVGAPMGKIPIMGPLIGGLSPIYVRRVKEDTARVNDLMVEAILAGQSILMAPESPKTTIHPAKGLRQFRAGLLESAVRTRTPVHYVAVTYRTPAGYPPPSEALIFGPNPYMRGPDGKIPQSELDIFGPERSFLAHLLGVLALPSFEWIATFAPEPIEATDRIALANQLQDAVARIFVPME